jgi:nucleotide-binding universal stress UspA family protein
MTVLAAFDSQTLDRAPVRFAAAVARFADVPLLIASIRTDVAPAPSARDDRLGEELERLCADLARDNGVEVRTRVVKALPPARVARSLQAVIDEERASLVVVGSSKRGVIGRVAPGTTAQRVINGSACPGVVVPHGYDRPNQLTTIGVAFVPTPEGRRALHEAASIAQMLDADLRVLTVVTPGIGTNASAGPTGEAAGRNHAEIADSIAGLAGGVRTASEVLVGDPANALVSASQQLDLLVMGSRGYRPGLAVLLGSVSRRVTVRAHCPVLVVSRGSASALLPRAGQATTTVCVTYPDEALARHAVHALSAAGVPPQDIVLLTGPRIHDIRDETVGGFAAGVEPTSPVGTYAGPARLRRRGAGGFAGDPDQQRQGSFGDADVDATISCLDGAGKVRVGDDVGLRQLLRDAALPETAADRVIGELRTGHAVMLVRTDEITAIDARQWLKQAARAA